MEIGSSDSSEVPLGLAARPRRMGTSDSLQTSPRPRYGDFAAAGIFSKPEPPANFLTYMNFLAEHKHEVPVLSSVGELVDKDRDQIGTGATFAVFKGRWGEGKAAFKYLKDGIIPQIADRQDMVVAADDWGRTRRKRRYDSAMKSLMFEIKIMAKRPLSRHRNIIRLLGISWDEDKEVEQPALTDPIRPVLIVELAWQEYPDLATYANKKPGHPSRLTKDEALSIAADVADGLAALHSFGVVHGDLKPANVLLFLNLESTSKLEPGKTRRPYPVAKIGDFGYSGTVSLEDDVRGGTHFWNAPECLDSCHDKELKAFATHQTRDIYSFGLLLVYVWTGGGNPFDGITSSLATVDRAKLDDRISDHCCALVRNSNSSDIAGQATAIVEDVVRDTLYRDPRLRCSNIGDVGSKLTSKEQSRSVEEVERFTRATFFSLRVSGAPELMSYENVDRSSLWRDFDKEIPESRKRLLRRGIDLDYIKTLTKPERRAMFLSGHAFVNAEREAKGQAPLYPRSLVHPDFLQDYPEEERLRIAEELEEAGTNMDDNMIVGTRTEESSMIIQGLSYSYQPQGILGATVSLKSCIELYRQSIARTLLRLGQVSLHEHIGSSFSLMHLAALYNHPDFIHLLVEHGLDVNQRGGKMCMTPLHEAIRTGNFEATFALLNHGANLEAEIQQLSFVRGFTPLEFAILGPAISPKVLSLLLERGARYGHNTRSIGTIEGSATRPSLLKVLLDHDDRLVQLETRQKQIIHAAVIANEPMSVRMLLEGGADPNARDLKGRTPLALQSSVNKFGTFYNNGMYGGVLGKSRQLRPQVFNPEHWDEIRQILLNYGGEEPDDYIDTVGERRIMEAVARYIYWLCHLGTAFFRNSVVSKLVQGIASGTSPMGPAILYGMAVKHAVEHKCIITGYFKDMHTLALVTEHLPVGSVVLTVCFTADFKGYLATWREKIDWDEFTDFIIAVLGYMQDPRIPESSVPAEISNADLDNFINEPWNPLRDTEPLGPVRRRILEWVCNFPVPADCDAAMKCLLSSFVSELPQGSQIPDEVRDAFDEIKLSHKSFTEDFTTHGFVALHQLMHTLLPASSPPTAIGGLGRASGFMTADSTFDAANYQPKFLSDLDPSSPIYICSINTEPPALRKYGFVGILLPFLLTSGFILWRFFIWLHWMSPSRFSSLLLLFTVHRLVQSSPTAQTDFSYPALMAVWLAHDRIWQIVLEYLLLKTPLSYILFTEPFKALIHQIALRWHHGFPDIEPLILSHADGKEWKYDFAQLLEGLHGGYATLTTRKGWIERADAISTVLDEWKREVCEGHEPTVKNWTNGWWFYIQESGTWRKSTFVENSRPERFLPMYGRIEELCHSKGRPELYQRFRELFPKIVSGETYRVLEREFAEYPDILEVTQGILFDWE